MPDVKEEFGALPWRCPLCGGALTGAEALRCEKGHSFDRAKEGYWHLLPVQKMRTKAPGDSKEMVAARRAFLEAGYYGIFGQALGQLALEYGAPANAGKALRLLDAGCGEGWYDRCIARAFEEAGRPLELAGFDIAKPAVRLAAKALPAGRYAVASSFSQPVRDGWADLLLNIFSPFAREEFLRVLRPGGRLAVITFHSLEDRIVKTGLAAFAKGCTCPPDFPVCVCGKTPDVKLISRKPILPTAEEIAENPRARSAKLRAAEKLKPPAGRA